MANKYTNRDLLEHNFNESDYASITSAQQQKTAAEQALSNLGDYNFNYGRQNDYNNAIDAILNRKKFSYDLNGDALYQQYKDNYINQGKMAMMDTMGQAAAMTGGYGNSYAATVGNQAYQASLQNLNNIVPELYKLALESYKAEGDRLNNNLSVLGTDRQLEENSYSNQYNANLTKLTSDRDYYSQNYNDTFTKEYNNYVDYITNNNESYWNEYNTGYQAERDSIADQQWNDSYKLQERQVEAAEAAAAAAAKESAYTLSKSQENEYMKLINGGKYADAEAYIDKLLEKGLSDTQAGYWLSLIPDSYYSNGTTTNKNDGDYSSWTQSGTTRWLLNGNILENANKYLKK